MGIETSPPDVEESTEPPICSLPSEHTQRIDVEKQDIEKIDQPSPVVNDAQLPAVEPCQRIPESLSDYPHTVDPAQLAASLDVQLQYVFLFFSGSSTNQIAMVCQIPNRRPVSSEMGRTGSEKCRECRSGRYC